VDSAALQTRKRLGHERHAIAGHHRPAVRRNDMRLVNERPAREIGMERNHPQRFERTAKIEQRHAFEGDEGDPDRRDMGHGGPLAERPASWQKTGRTMSFLPRPVHGKTSLSKQRPGRDDAMDTRDDRHEWECCPADEHTRTSSDYDTGT